jgi:hypothetical protein
MFVLKSTHEKLIQAEKQRCDDVVAQMQARIQDLSRLVFVSEPTHEQTLPIRAANAILDGVEVMPKRDEKLEADELAEANRILSGEYSNSEEAAW